MKLYLFLIFSSFIFSLIELFTNQVNKSYFKKIQKIYIVILFILFIFNRDNRDYQAYLDFFDEKNLTEKGYMFLIKVVKVIGGNHNIILLILGMLLIYTLFYLYKTKYVISYIFLYMMLSFVYDINQIRNLFCILFVLIGIKMLQKNKYIQYIFMNILSFLFQRFGYVYILFFISQKLKVKDFKKIIFILFILGFFGIMVVEQIIIFLFPEKANYYFQYKPRFGVLIYYVLLGTDIFLLKLIKNKKESKKEMLLRKFILFQFIFLAYSSLHLEIISRVWRNTLYIKWFYSLRKMEEKRKKNKILIFSLLVFQQLILLGVGLFFEYENTIELLSEISNIKFHL